MKDHLAQVFAYNDIPLRTAGTIDDPLFVAADACRCQGVANPSDALARLDDDEKGIASIDTPGGPQAMLCVTEAGLYTLVLGSRKPEAKRFRRWLTHVVIPTIRKTGSYAPESPSIADMVSAIVPAIMTALSAEMRKLSEAQAETSAFIRPYQARIVKRAITTLAKARTRSASDPKACRRERGALELSIRSDFRFFGAGKRWETFPMMRWPEMKARLEEMGREAGRSLAAAQLSITYPTLDETPGGDHDLEN